MFYRKESDHLEADEIVSSRELQLRLQQIGLLVVFIASFYHLATGQLPWSHKVMERIAEVAPEIQNPKAMVMLPAWFHSEIDHPGVLTLKEHVVIGLWWGAAIAAGISFVLLLTASWWLPRSQKEGDEVLELDEQEDENAGDTGLAKLVSSGPIFYLFLAAAMIVGGWLRAPMLEHSLWEDEAYAMRHFSHGSWEPDKQGKLTFEPVPWQETLFGNSLANNHLFNSLATRLSLDLWRGSAKAAPSEFSEGALRTPALIAGVLAIGLIGFLGWEIGLPWMGIGAAWLLALHPWHLRYSGEGQGYGMMIFFICLSLYGLVRGLKFNHVFAWQLFAVGEVGYLLSFPGSIYVAIAVNALAFIELLIRRQPKRLIALIAFNLLAAMPVIVWTLPSVPQVLGFAAHDTAGAASQHGDWIQNLGSHVAAGVSYANNETGEHVGTSWMQMIAASHTLPAVLAWGVGLLLVLGLIATLIENRAARVVIWGVALGGVLGWWHSGGHPPAPAYFSYLLIPAALAIGLACVRLQIWPALVVILVVGFFGMASETPRHVIAKNDRQPIKATVAAIREKRRDALTGTFGVSELLARSYDPHVRLLATPADVDNLLAEGQQQGHAVFIYFCGVNETTHAHPDLVKRVANPNEFVPYKELKGLEAMYSYHVFAWTGGPP